MTGVLTWYAVKYLHRHPTECDLDWSDWGDVIVMADRIERERIELYEAMVTAIAKSR